MVLVVLSFQVRVYEKIGEGLRTNDFRVTGFVLRTGSV